MSIISDLSTLATQRHTYEIGLLQAQAYRILKQTTATVLKPEGLTTIEWAVIGIIVKKKSSVRASELADALGVRAPLVSRIIQKIAKSGWITVKTGTDKRERLVSITPQGSSQVARIEKSVRAQLKPLLHKAKLRDVVGYLRIIELIAENGQAGASNSATDYIPEL